MSASLSPRSIQLNTCQHQPHQQAPLSSPSSSSLPFLNSRSFPSSLQPLLERRGRAIPQLQIRSFQQAAAAADEPVPTPYVILGVPPTASDGDIKTAYRRLARQFHPDRAPLAEKEASTNKFLQINSAYSILSDPSRRAQYDLQLSLTTFQSTGYKSRYPCTPRAYSASAPSSAYCAPRSPFSSGRGRSWETDQCWC